MYFKKATRLSCGSFQGDVFMSENELSAMRDLGKRKLTKQKNIIFKNMSGTQGLLWSIPWTHYVLPIKNSPHSFSRTWRSTFKVRSEGWWCLTPQGQNLPLVKYILDSGKMLHSFIMEKKMAKFPKDLALVFALSFLKLSSCSKANMIKMVMMCLHTFCRAKCFQLPLPTCNCKRLPYPYI